MAYIRIILIEDFFYIKFREVLAFSRGSEGTVILGFYKVFVINVKKQKNALPFSGALIVHFCCCFFDNASHIAAEVLQNFFFLVSFFHKPTKKQAGVGYCHFHNS